MSYADRGAAQLPAGLIYFEDVAAAIVVVVLVVVLPLLLHRVF